MMVAEVRAMALPESHIIVSGGVDNIVFCLFLELWDS